MTIKVSAREGERLTPLRLHDIRQRAAKRRKVDQDVRKKLGPYNQRSWEQTRGIVLHQTAVEMSPTERRWESLGAHIGITRLADIMWVHDLDRVVWHANGFNNQCVGIEVDGRYEGILGDRRTLWEVGEPSELTDAMVESARESIRWVCDVVERNGGKVEVILPHRASSATRPADPGEDIWKRVAIPMAEELLLDAETWDGGPGFCVGGGSPIPVQWDYRREGFDYFED